MTHVLTKHAETRCNQRGIRLSDLDLILSFGQQIGPNTYLMTDAVIDQEIASSRRDKPKVQQLERLRGKEVIVCGTSIVTIYHANKSDLRRCFRKGRARRQPRYGRARQIRLGF